MSILNSKQEGILYDLIIDEMCRLRSRKYTCGEMKKVVYTSEDMDLIESTLYECVDEIGYVESSRLELLLSLISEELDKLEDKEVKGEIKDLENDQYFLDLLEIYLRIYAVREVDLH